jgi:hypothetical protein
MKPELVKRSGGKTERYGAVCGRSMFRATAVVMSAAMIDACAAINDVNCFGLPVVSVEVYVIDSRTSLPIDSGATVIVRDGSATSLTVYHDKDFRKGKYSAGNRAGTFSVTVDVGGYSRFVQNDIAVSKDKHCGYLNTARVDARIAPL